MFYNPRTNFYYLKKDKEFLKFEHPEDLLQCFLEVNSFFIPFQSASAKKKGLYVETEIKISLKTGFSEELRKKSKPEKVNFKAHARSQIF
jgi:hypothetical protein